MGLELELLGLLRLLGGCDSGAGPGGRAGAPGTGKSQREGLAGLGDSERLLV